MHMHPILADFILIVSSKTCAHSWGILNAGEALQKNAFMFERDSGADLGRRLKMFHKTKQEPRKYKNIEWQVEPKR